VRLNPLVAVALVAAASVARAEIIELTWDPAGRFERQLAVPAGKFAELCGKLGVSATVRWEFDAPAPLNFNIHYHEGKDVRYPARHDSVQRMQGVLTVASPQDHCWMWTNKGSEAIRLSVRLMRD
jgi:hypothetical protein